MKNLFVLAFLTISMVTMAQTEVKQSSTTFQDGVHPTFAVTFEAVDAKALEAYWKGQLKDMSEELSTKKELAARRTRIPSISPDTITVLGIADQPKKSPETTMHLAFNVGGEYITNGSEKSIVDACRAFVYEKSVSYKRDLLSAKLETEKKNLEKLQRVQSSLGKDKERTLRTLDKTRDKLRDLEKEKAGAEAEAKALDGSIKVKQQEVGAAPTEANTAALNELIRDRDKQIGIRDRADKAARSAEKKVGDLEHGTKKNMGDQQAKKAEIDSQTKMVEEMTKALNDLN